MNIREVLDRLDEIGRRDFLKGAGAIASAAALGTPKDASALSYNPKTDAFTFDNDDMIIIAKFISLEWLCKNQKDFHGVDLPWCDITNRYKFLFTQRYRNGQDILTDAYSKMHKAWRNMKQTNPAHYEQVVREYISGAKSIIEDFKSLIY